MSSNMVPQRCLIGNSLARQMQLFCGWSFPFSRPLQIQESPSFSLLRSYVYASLDHLLAQDLEQPTCCLDPQLVKRNHSCIYSLTWQSWPPIMGTSLLCHHQSNSRCLSQTLYSTLLRWKRCILSFLCSLLEAPFPKLNLKVQKLLYLPLRVEVR